ncbi:MAG: gliding motility lipoprotein GldH [Chitinophagaceae bacterium]|nr:gliding motility lipoprotein GldH [Chitinophagaceae bacterium]
MYKLIIGVLILSLTSCVTLDVYEKNHLFPTQTWNSTDSLNFSFDVIDTSSYYNFYFVLRHQEKYPFKNIWIELIVNDPDTTTTIKREFTLADNNKWLGSTIDDITDHRLIFNPQPIRLKKGNYNFNVRQIMRVDPLPYIMSAGIRVQKVSR